MDFQKIIEQIPLIILTGIVSGIGSGILTHYLTSRRSVAEMKRKNYENQLEKVYTPILQIIHNTVVPGDGYEGLSAHDFTKITKIVEENYQYVDLQLDTIIWSLKEEERWYWDQRLNVSFLDEDRKLLNHINAKYNLLKKKLYLPYDKKRLFPYTLIQKFQKMYYNWTRERKLRKLQRKRSNPSISK